MSLADNAERKGDEYVASAEKRLKSFHWFNKSAQYEDASEMYQKAAAQFKISKSWNKCGDAFVKAAELSEKSGNGYDATNYYTQAAKAYKNENPTEAIKYFGYSIAQLLDNNKFSMAAKLHKTVGEIYEEENNTTKAIEAYEHAADCFMAEDSKTTGQQMRIKVADMCSQSEDYKKAIDIYEDVASASADNSLTKWSVTDYCFKALLCRFVIVSKEGNPSYVSDALEDYKDRYPAFERSRECKVISNLADAYVAGDVEKFEDTLSEYDNISRLDKWKVDMLLKVKRAMGKPDAIGETDTADAHNDAIVEDIM